MYTIMHFSSSVRALILKLVQRAGFEPTRSGRPGGYSPVPYLMGVPYIFGVSGRIRTYFARGTEFTIQHGRQLPYLTHCLDHTTGLKPVSTPQRSRSCDASRFIELSVDNICKVGGLTSGATAYCVTLQNLDLPVGFEPTFQHSKCRDLPVSRQENYLWNGPAKQCNVSWPKVVVRLSFKNSGTCECIVHWSLTRCHSAHPKIFFLVVDPTRLAAALQASCTSFCVL